MVHPHEPTLCDMTIKKSEVTLNDIGKAVLAIDERCQWLLTRKHQTKLPVCMD